MREAESSLTDVFEGVVNRGTQTVCAGIAGNGVESDRRQRFDFDWQRTFHRVSLTLRNALGILEGS